MNGEKVIFRDRRSPSLSVSMFTQCVFLNTYDELMSTFRSTICSNNVDVNITEKDLFIICWSVFSPDLIVEHFI